MSTGLLYLTHREFSLQLSKSNTHQNQQKYDLVHKVPGICFVFFYSKSCEYCKNLISSFKTLPGKINGVNFAMANISADNSRILQMSQASTTPIQYVPYLALYVNGQYYIEYKGSKSIDHILRAIHEIVGKINSGREFVNGQVQKSEHGANVYYDGSDDSEERCVMTYDEAYGGRVCDYRSGKCFTYDEAYHGKVCDEGSGLCYTYDQAYNGAR